ncbi:MAG TPA: acyl-CoA desaturase [Gemmatimonadales bacterium]|nr:acyl-CoA desaturase [Gemmatimonadales bacterium]
MATIAPSFPAGEGSAFMRDLRAEVESFMAGSKMSPKGSGRMVAKTIAMLALTFVPYGFVMSGRLSPGWMLAMAVLTGLGIAGVGFSVAHDALHGSYSSSPRVNRIVGLSMDLIGGSSYLWRITHNIIHHTYTNIHGTDEDLAVSPLLRLSPHAPRHWYHRFQHFYAIPLYSMTTLFWVFVKDYKYLLAPDLGPYKDKRHAPGDVAGLFAGKVVYYGWSLVLPFTLLALPWWQILMGILVMHAVAGITLGIVFQLAHVVEQTMHPEPTPAGTMPDDWVTHEMATTANFAPRSGWLSWYVGGLNYQIEHHLFPKICSEHYPALSAIVRRVATRHGLPYHSHATLLGAIRSHLRTLRAFGRGATVPVSELQVA